MDVVDELILILSRLTPAQLDRFRSAAQQITEQMQGQDSAGR